MIDFVAQLMKDNYVPTLVNHVQQSINEESKPHIMNTIKQKDNTYRKLDQSMKTIYTDCSAAPNHVDSLQEKQQNLDKLLQMNRHDLREYENKVKQIEGDILQNKSNQNDIDDKIQQNTTLLNNLTKSSKIATRRRNY